MGGGRSLNEKLMRETRSTRAFFREVRSQLWRGDDDATSSPQQRAKTLVADGLETCTGEESLNYCNVTCSDPGVDGGKQIPAPH